MSDGMNGRQRSAMATAQRIFETEPEPVDYPPCPKCEEPTENIVMESDGETEWPEAKPCNACKKAKEEEAENE